MIFAIRQVSLMATENALVVTQSPADDDRCLPLPVIVSRKRWKTVGIWLIKVALAVGCFIWLVRSGKLDFSRLMAIRGSLSLTALVACTLIAMLLPAYRWWLLLRVQGIHESMGLVLRVTWISYFAGLFLPGAAGGDLAKGVLVVRGRSAGRWRAISTVLVDRLFGVYSLLCITLVPCAWILLRQGFPSAGVVVTTVITLWIVATIGLAILSWAPFQRLVGRLFPSERVAAITKSWSLYWQAIPAMGIAFLLSLASNLLWCAALYFAAQSLQLGIEPFKIFLVAPLVFLSNCLPLTPGGTGIGEAVSQQLFASMKNLGGGEAMLLLRTITIVLSVPVVLFMLKEHQKPSTTNCTAITHIS
jgi:uncharacterized membrane protein YbhN (UPF0104 family)